MGNVRVDTCGYTGYRPPEGWKERYKSKLQAYSAVFETVEINQTFYKLPMTKTARRWREEAFDTMEFQLKAWQAITHRTGSPTWRKRKDKLTQSQLESFGDLRPNREVRAAWEATRERAQAMQARVCVLQTASSFECNARNEKNLKKLLGEIDRGGLALAWEPRGDWNENLDTVRDLCKELDLIHIVDIMRRSPVSSHPIAYIRLHGLNRRETDYRYDYSPEEIRDLASRLKDLAESHDTVYCLFNNDAMFENAPSLKERL